METGGMMAQKPLTFKQRDLAAAMRAAKQAGMSPSRVEVDRDGKIVLVFPNAEGQEERGHEWDGAHS